MLPRAAGGWINCNLSEIGFCAAVAPNESEYEGTNSEPGSEPETGPEDEGEEGPRLRGVTLYLSTEGMSRHDRLNFVS